MRRTDRSAALVFAGSLLAVAAVAKSPPATSQKTAVRALPAVALIPAAASNADIRRITNVAQSKKWRIFSDWEEISQPFVPTAHIFTSYQVSPASQKITGDLIVVQAQTVSRLLMREKSGRIEFETPDAKTRFPWTSQIASGVLEAIAKSRIDVVLPELARFYWLARQTGDAQAVHDAKEFQSMIAGCKKNQPATAPDPTDAPPAASVYAPGSVRTTAEGSEYSGFFVLKKPLGLSLMHAVVSIGSDGLRFQDEVICEHAQRGY